MRSSGKVSITAIIVCVILLGMAVFALSTGESPTSAASRFMGALATRDVDTLAEMSYAPGYTKEEMTKKWKYTEDVVAPYFPFTYEIKGESEPAKDAAIVWMAYTNDAGKSGSYEKRLELQLHKTPDGWKVDVFSMPRDLYPGLPRAD